MKTRQVLEVLCLALLVFMLSIGLYKLFGIDSKIDRVENKVDIVDDKVTSIKKEIDEGFTIIVE